MIFPNRTIETICEPKTTDCTISSNLICVYNWLAVRNDIPVPVLTPVLPESHIEYVGYGWYNCSVQCPIRGQQCRLTGRVLEYKDCDTTQNTTLTTTAVDFETQTMNDERVASNYFKTGKESFFSIRLNYFQSMVRDSLSNVCSNNV